MTRSANENWRIQNSNVDLEVQNSDSKFVASSTTETHIPNHVQNNSQSSDDTGNKQLLQVQTDSSTPAADTVMVISSSNGLLATGSKPHLQVDNNNTGGTRETNTEMPSVGHAYVQRVNNSRDSESQHQVKV